MSNRIIKYAVLLVATLLFLNSVMAVSLAVSGSMNIDGLYKNDSTVKRIQIQNPSDSALSFSVSFEGPEKDWFSVEEDKFTVEARGRKNIYITITPSADAANTTYKDNRLVVGSVPTTDSSGKATGVSIRGSLVLPISLSISGEQSIKIDSIKMEISDTEVNKETNILLSYKNKGNVTVEPNLEIKITDSKGKVVLTKIIATEKVAPFNIGSSVLPLDTSSLDIGDYTVEMKFTYNGQVYKTETLSLSIKPVGTFSILLDLDDITYPQQIERGSVLELSGNVVNIGKLNIFAELNAKIYDGDKIVKVIKSNPVKINISEKSNLQLFYTADKEMNMKVDLW